MKYKNLKVLACLCTAIAFGGATVNAETLTTNETGTDEGFYYTFWKDTGDASFTLETGGRYQSQWNSSTNNWVGGKGWNPGGRKAVNYEGYYGVDSTQNSYIALYGWTRDPLIEYYVIESFGSYDPSSCSGGQDFGTFESDGGTYKIRRCERVQQPSIEGTQTFYQYFSVRQNKKGFGNISGTVTTGNHFDAWASAGLNLGAHDYMVLATEGYQSTGSSDITVSEGNSNTAPSNSDIIVRAQGLNGDEHINLLIDNTVVADWTLSTSMTNYSYSGSADGDIQVEYDNDGSGRDVTLDYVFANGEIREAEDMEHNTAAYGNGECGGGSYSELMNCSGIIGFGDTGACFSNDCTDTSDTANSGGGTGGSGSGSSGSGGSTSGSDIVVRAQGLNGDEHINLLIDGNIVADWILGSTMANYSYTGNATGDVQVEYDNDASGRDVTLDSVFVNGETREAEDMEYNTATYGNGECGGGSYSELMNCSGIIGFGSTEDCFSNSCTNTSSSSNGTETTPPNTNTPNGSQCNWYGTTYPICQSATGWGWENNQTCLGVDTCGSENIF